MRIFATFFVIFNHTGNKGFFLFSMYNKHSLPFWIYLTLSIFCKFSVPIFFMITGSLMLNREPEPLSRLYRQRVLKILLVLVFWSFFYYLFLYGGIHDCSLKKFLTQLYDSNWNPTYWYLYAYIPLLLSLPLLQKFAKSLSNKDYMYIYILFTFFNMALPVFHNTFVLINAITIYVTCQYFTAKIKWGNVGIQ